MDAIGKIMVRAMVRLSREGMTKHLKSSSVLRCGIKTAQHRLSMLMSEVDFLLLSRIEQVESDGVAYEHTHGVTRFDRTITTMLACWLQTMQIVPFSGAKENVN